MLRESNVMTDGKLEAVLIWDDELASPKDALAELTYGVLPEAASFSEVVEFMAEVQKRVADLVEEDLVNQAENDLLGGGRCEMRQPAINITTGSVGKPTGHLTVFDPKDVKDVLVDVLTEIIKMDYPLVGHPGYGEALGYMGELSGYVAERFVDLAMEELEHELTKKL